MIYGYARASSVDQNTEIQEAALKQAGCETIRSEKRSGTTREGRTELRMLIDFARKGDTLMVTRVDRLARSIGDLQDIVRELKAKGVHLKAVEQPIDTSNAAGKAFLDMLGVFAEFETNLRKERQMEGIAKAKAEGVYKGRKPSIDTAAVRQLQSEGVGPTVIAQRLGIGRASVYRVLREATSLRSITCLLALCLVITLAPSARAETQLERGAYLVQTVGACGICHSPVDQNGNRNGPPLSGGPATLSPAFVAYPPNLTPDLKTGIGSWSEDQIVTALREGRTPEGHVLRPPMPIGLYRALSDNDAHAIAVYLKSLPPTEHQVPESTYKVPTPASYGPPVGVVADPPRTNPIVYGAYLAKVSHCVQCHTPIGSDGRRDYVNRLGAGGLSIDTAWGSRVSANITPDLETGIGNWSDDQIVNAVSHGIRIDGTPLAPMMPWPYWQAMKTEDLQAIVAWLRTIKPVSNAVVR